MNPNESLSSKSNMVAVAVFFCTPDLWLETPTLLSCGLLHKVGPAVDCLPRRSGANFQFGGPGGLYMAIYGYIISEATVTCACPTSILGKKNEATSQTVPGQNFFHWGGACKLLIGWLIHHPSKTWPTDRRPASGSAATEASPEQFPGIKNGNKCVVQFFFRIRKPWIFGPCPIKINQYITYFMYCMKFQ